MTRRQSQPPDSDPHDLFPSDASAEADPLFEEVVAQALDGEPRARQLQEMTQILMERFRGLKADYQNESDTTAKAKLKRELVKLREQITVLHEEARITEFVEGTARASLKMRESEDS